MNEAFDFERAARRIARNMLWVAFAGAVAGWAAAGWRWAAGFLLGAAISLVNYRGLRGIVENLGGRSPDRRASAWPGGLRFVFQFIVLGGAAYVILRFSRINVLAVLIGLFVLIAAVFIEAAFEIFYAGKRTLDHQDL
ncbi:MAG TPA: ATP synthase subunit I [Bryobacteraceae bacterium]|nr:ATP synthase subunit I [Bryobacteraceae bacterium]